MAKLVYNVIQGALRRIGLMDEDEGLSLSAGVATASAVIASAERRIGVTMEDEGLTLSAATVSANTVVQSALRRAGVILEEEALSLTAATVTAGAVIQSALRRSGVILEEDGFSVSASVTATANVVINDAFHRLGIVSEDESVTAPQLVRGLSVLNDMMSGWAAEGIAYAHTALAATDLLTVPAFLVQPVEFALCIAIAAEYGVTIGDERAALFGSGKPAIAAHYARTNRALTVMNEMMASWAVDGIAYTHTDLTISTTIAVPEAIVHSVEWLLTGELAREYGRQLDQTATDSIGMARNALQAHYARTTRGLTLLNEMMNSWAIDGIAYTHTDLTASGIIQVPKAIVRSVELLLVAEVAKEYGRQLDQPTLDSIGQAKSALQAHYGRTTRGLSLLNQMMQSWAGEGLGYTHTDLTISTVLAVPEYLTRSVEWMLCKDMSIEYGRQLGPAETDNIGRAWAALKSHYWRMNRGLTVLNDMLQGFEAEGIQYIPEATLTLTATIDMPDFLVRSLEWMLADDLASEAEKELSPRQQLQVDRARSSLQSYFFRVPVAQTDEGVLNRRVGSLDLTYLRD